MEAFPRRKIVRSSKRSMRVGKSGKSKAGGKRSAEKGKCLRNRVIVSLL